MLSRCAISSSCRRWRSNWALVSPASRRDRRGQSPSSSTRCSFALGGRGDAGVVREARRAEIGAEFDALGPGLAAWFAEAGLPRTAMAATITGRCAA